MQSNVFLDLTRAFNQGGLRAVVSSGQAVVLHGLALASKDGDWILRETPEALQHVVHVLAGHGARYRFGAPLDVRWMSGGWSAHFEYRSEILRVRTDFVTRPPRLTPDDLASMWAEQERADAQWPVLDVSRLIEIKKTNREKDYAVIGELARLLEDPRQRLLATRSAKEILAAAERSPSIAQALSPARPLLRLADRGLDAVEAALDAERRSLMHANERRIARYLSAAERWAEAWPDVARRIRDLPLLEAHEVVAARAESVLPFVPPEDPS